MPGWKQASLWWNKTLAVVPASADDSHRPLDLIHCLPPSLSYVETRQVGNDYTFRFDHRIYQIARAGIRPGLRGAEVRVEVRLDASMAVRFRSHYLAVTECEPAPKGTAPPRPRKPAAPRPKSRWMSNFHLTSPEKTALAVIETPLARSEKSIR